jgi:hypothetical protein
MRFVYHTDDNLPTHYLPTYIHISAICTTWSVTNLQKDDYQCNIRITWAEYHRSACHQHLIGVGIPTYLQSPTIPGIWCM